MTWRNEAAQTVRGGPHLRVARRDPGPGPWIGRRGGRGAGSSGWIAPSVGAILGGASGAAASLLILPVYYRLFNPDTNELIVGLVTQMVISSCIGSAGGVAFGIGRGERGFAVRRLVGGLLGAVAGVLVYQMAGAIAFPLDGTSTPIPVTTSDAPVRPPRRDDSRLRGRGDGRSEPGEVSGPGQSDAPPARELACEDAACLGASQFASRRANPARGLGAGSPSRKEYPVPAGRDVHRSVRPEGQRTSTCSTRSFGPSPKWRRGSSADM